MLQPHQPMDARTIPLTSALRPAFAAASPRLTPRAMPAVSYLIYLVVIGVWALLAARALWLDNVWAWSAGVVYLLYDTVLTLLVAGLTWPRRAARSERVSAATRPTLGIVIASRDEAAHLPATLDAILAQSLQPATIWIADDGSADGTTQMLADRYGLSSGASIAIGATTLRHLALAPRGKAHALNAALVQSHEDIMVTLDADTHLEPGALQAISDAFAADANLVAAGGIIIPVCEPTLSGRALQFFQTYEYIRNMISRFAWMRARSLLLISGAFGAYRRDALITVGGFDPRCIVEDYEVTHRLHRYSIEHGRGWQLAMIGGALAKTDAPPNVPAFLRQRRRWFAGFLQTQYWNRDMTGNRRFGPLGLFMLPVKALDTLQPIYGLLAAVLFLALIASGNAAAALSVASFIAAKIAFDFAAFLWNVRLYRQITGGRAPASYAHAIVAALLEPFSFQLLRHAGAALGWVGFFRGSREWGQTRVPDYETAEPAIPPRAAE